MSENKQIKSLIAGLVANDDDKVDQLVKTMVESLCVNKQPVIDDVICESFQGVIE